MTRKYDPIIQAAAIKWLPQIDWRLYRSLLVIESQLNPKAVSPAGAGGIAQIMPDTFLEWAPKAGYPVSDRFDPEASIHTGACYLARLYNQWSSPRPQIDRICLAMASYNAGLGNVLKAQQAAKMLTGYKEIISALPTVTGERSKETMAYAPKILHEWVKEVAGQ